MPVNLKVGGPLRLEGFDSRVVKVSLGAKHSGIDELRESEGDDEIDR